MGQDDFAPDALSNTNGLLQVAIAGCEKNCVRCTVARQMDEVERHERIDALLFELGSEPEVLLEICEADAARENGSLDSSLPARPPLL